MLVMKGKLMQEVDAGSIARLSMYDTNPRVTEPAMWHLEYQVFNLDDGTPSKGDYKGEGHIVNAPGTYQRLILGGRTSTSFATEYLVSREATPESNRSLDDFIEGLVHGVKGGRLAAKSESWKQGQREGAKLKKIGVRPPW
jgi:hypothetical protein